MFLRTAGIKFNTIISLIIILSGGFFSPAFASTDYSVTTTADFNAGISSNVTITDIGGGDGNANNTLGSETLDQSQITGTTAQGFDSAKWLAQIFTPSQNGLLSKITVSLRRQTGDDSSGNVTVEIRNSSGGNPGTVILTSTSTSAMALPTSQGNADFSFTNPIAVSAGTQYAIVVYRSGTSDVDDYDWYREGSSADYAGGGRFQSTDSGNAWSSQTHDQHFSQYYRAYVTSGTQTSEVLDADSPMTKYSRLSWNETLSAGSDIIFEIRASANSFLKTDVAPDWISLGLADSPINLNTILPSDYQYFQWRATLIGTATTTPTLSDVTTTYNRQPVLTAINNQNTDEDQLLTFTVSASDLDSDTLNYSASNLPTGAAFDADTQTFSWTPDYSQAGIYDSVHFEVSDGLATTSEDIQVTVTDINRPPTLDIIGNKTGNENENLTFTVLASDPDNDTLSYSASNLPAGAAFDTDTQTFSWIPDFDQSGNYSVTFTTSDGEFEDSEDVPIDIGNVNRSPELSAIGNKTGSENENLTFTITASDSDNNPLTYSTSNLPAGATFDADTQTFSWTPDYSQSGVYDSVHFEATDSFATDAEDISITINNINREPTLGSIGNQSGSENSNLTFTISGSDPDSDTLIYSASNLPSGATFDANTHTFSWTPSPIQSGTYDNVYFEISDNSAIASENITITIDNTNQAPVLNSIGNKNGNEGSALTFTISATDSDNDALTYSTSNLPSGATFDANTRTFSWTLNYSQSGDYPLVHFDVGDGLATTSEDITVTIINTNRTPILDAIGNKTINENQLLTFTISGSDPENDALTYSASNLPAGATFDTSAKTFNWAPGYSQSGSYPSVHFEVTDGSLITNEDITITANNVSQDDGGVFYSAISLPTPQAPIQNTQIMPVLTNPTIPVLENISPLVAITQPNSSGPIAQDQKPAEQPLISRTSAPIANQNPAAVSETPAQNISLLANIAGFVKNPNILEDITGIYQRFIHYLKSFF